MTALVRFARTHSDDDEYVCTKFGPYPGASAYLAQLVEELRDGGFDKTHLITLSFAQMGGDTALGVDKDVYILYARVPTLEGETAVKLAQRLQEAYDEGGAAGWFQVVGLDPSPDEWLAVVTDEDGDRIDSQTFSGEYSIDHVRDQAYAYFETMGTAKSGHNVRFYPIGPERVDLAIGTA
jgi:hypothetical protein